MGRLLNFFIFITRSTVSCPCNCNISIGTFSNTLQIKESLGFTIKPTLNTPLGTRLASIWAVLIETLRRDFSKKTNPTDSQIYKIEGLLHEALGNYKEAIKSWENCLKYSKGKQRLIKEAKNHLKNLLID